MNELRFILEDHQFRENSKVSVEFELALNCSKIKRDKSS
jgi:hypothetical protein